MIKRATRRPETFVKPVHWTNAPLPVAEATGESPEEGLSPTRYGDWVKNGIAIDF